MWEGSQISKNNYFFKFCWPFQKTFTKRFQFFVFLVKNTRFSNFSSFLYCMHHFHEFSLTLTVKESLIKCSMLVLFKFKSLSGLKNGMKIGTSSFAVELHLWQSSKWSWKFSNWMSRAGWLLPKLYFPIPIRTLLML